MMELRDNKTSAIIRIEYLGMQTPPIIVSMGQGECVDDLILKIKKLIEE